MTGQYHNDFDTKLAPALVSAAATDRNPVILIPGVMGSRLVSDDASQSLWGEFRIRDRKSAELARQFAIPMVPGQPLDRLRSATRPDGTLAQMEGRVAGMPVRLKVYANILSALGVSSHRESHAVTASGQLPPALEFDYDWRRSLDESARRLAYFIARATRFLQLQRGSTDPVRFDVVAHSMGGLVLRYFLLYGDRLLPSDGPPRPTWDGAALVDNAVIVGTPSAGSLFALGRLTTGMTGVPVIPSLDPILVGTMPSLYQLLPRAGLGGVFREPGRTDAADLLDADFWDRFQWSLARVSEHDRLARQLPDVDSASRRREIAVDHLHKCLASARVFHDAMDSVPPSPPAHLRLHLVAGQTHNTPLVATLDKTGRGVRYSRMGPGDGTVLRSSAALGRGGRAARSAPIRWHSVRFISSRHQALPQDPVFVRHLLKDLLRPHGSD